MHLASLIDFSAVGDDILKRKKSSQEENVMGLHCQERTLSAKICFLACGDISFPRFLTFSEKCFFPYFFSCLCRLRIL